MSVPRPDRPITRADVLTAREVADLALVHARTVHRWALEGNIPSRKHGRRVLFLRWEIEAWLTDTGGRGLQSLPTADDGHDSGVKSRRP